MENTLLRGLGEFWIFMYTVFQVLVPNMTVEPTDTVEHQWTILREVDHSFDESAETSKWHMLNP